MLPGRGSTAPSVNGCGFAWAGILSPARAKWIPGPYKEHRAVGGEERGYAAAKKFEGRKPRLLVDTEGFVLEAHVHSAKVMDHEGIESLLRKADERLPRLRRLWLDAGYRGEGKGAENGLRRPSDGAWIS